MRVLNAIVAVICAADIIAGASIPKCRTIDQINTLWPNKEDPMRYYVCIEYGIAESVNCAAGTKFSAAHQRCVPFIEIFLNVDDDVLPVISQESSEESGSEAELYESEGGMSPPVQDDVSAESLEQSDEDMSPADADVSAESLKQSDDPFRIQVELQLMEPLSEQHAMDSLLPVVPPWWEDFLEGNAPPVPGSTPPTPQPTVPGNTTPPTPQPTPPTPTPSTTPPGDQPPAVTIPPWWDGDAAPETVPPPVVTLPPWWSEDEDDVPPIVPPPDWWPGPPGEEVPPVVVPPDWFPDEPDLPPELPIVELPPGGLPGPDGPEPDPGI